MKEKHIKVFDRLERGDIIHMQILSGERQWWFENPRLDVDDDTMHLAIVKYDLVEYGDSLFGFRMNSQSWRVAQGKA